jgi:hypothetical protein
MRVKIVNLPLTRRLMRAEVVRIKQGSSEHQPGHRCVADGPGCPVVKLAFFDVTPAGDLKSGRYEQDAAGLRLR